MFGVEKSQAGCNENIIDTLSPIIKDINDIIVEKNRTLKLK